MGCEVVGGVGGYQWFLATPFGLLTAPLLTELNTNHLTGKRTPAAATKLQKTIYFNSISNKSRLELNVRQNGTIHEIQETHHVFLKTLAPRCLSGAAVVSVRTVERRRKSFIL